MNSRSNSLLLPLLVAALAASPTAPAAAPTATAVITHHATLVHANAQDSLAAAQTMQRAIETLLKSPSADTLAAARRAWVTARVPYLQLEATRFNDGPMDRLDPFMNAWPVDENYVDYVKGDANAGVINQPAKFPQLTKELLLTLNEKEGKKNIATGWHPIEFLLWGQDFNPTGPGNRPFTDFTPAGANHDRRAEYLRLTTALLVSHLTQLVAHWAPNQPDNYHAELLRLPPADALARILKGLGAFSGPELAGERLTVAYETKEQEDEHSCFSDNTHNDFIYDALGVQNFYLGRYTRTDGTRLTGPGVHDLLKAANPKLADRLAKEIETGLAAARAIPAPFDQAILGADTNPGRKAIKRAIASFWTQSRTTVEAATALGIKLKL